MLARKNFFLYKVAATLFLLTINLINIGNPILEQHSFRQTQTAISIFYLIQDGFTLEYITPVLGMNYAIPFEFPIFHFIVGFVAKYLGFNLDVAGRLVSLVFAVGVLIVNDLLLRELEVNARSRLFAFLMIICTPVFLFWSGTFMIESAAVFFAIASLLFAAKYWNTFRNKYLFYWFILVTFGLLQKVTTALFPYFIGCMLLLHAVFNNRKSRKALRGFLIVSLCILPICIGYSWVLYTDLLKSANPIAFFKLTSSALRFWNFGTLDQRLGHLFWISNMYLRAWAPSALMGIGLVTSFLYLVSPAKRRYSKWIVFGFVGLYFAPQLVFTNLFIVHNYYHYSVIVYLCNFVAISYAQIYENHQKLSLWLLAVTCLCSLLFFSHEYRHAKFGRISPDSRTLVLAHEIKHQIDSNDVFMLLGYDWSSEIAYYSERKALMIPDWYLEKLNMEKFDIYFDRAPRLIVICNNSNHKYDSFMPKMSEYSLAKEIQGCLLFKLRGR